MTAAPSSPLRRVRELRIAGDGPKHIAAASGAAVVGGKLWVVADDELHLGCFDLAGRAPGRAHRVLGGELPTAPEARKKAKPDFEALAPVEKGHGLEAGLLALGSGSKARRARGVFLPLSPSGEPASGPRPVDLSVLYRRLAVTFRDLNIEGATLHGGALVLAQRGNGAAGENALVFLDWAIVASAVARGQAVPETAVRRVLPIALTSLRGEGGAVPLSLTDICALPDGRIVFTAAAEATGGSTYNDGVVVGSVVGVIDATGAVSTVRTVRTHKLEGVHATLRADGRVELLLVTDADDPSKPARLFAMTL